MEINPRLQVALERELEGDEELLWAGHPYRGWAFTKFDFFLIPFSLLMSSVAMPFGALAILLDPTPFVAIGGGAFVLISLQFLVGRFLIDIWVRRKTIYGLTKDRVLIRQGLVFVSTKSIPFKTVRDLGVVQRPDGTGTVRFGTPESMTSWSIMAAVLRGATTSGTPKFYRIARCQDVFWMVDEALSTDRGKT